MVGALEADDLEVVIRVVSESNLSDIVEKKKDIEFVSDELEEGIHYFMILLKNKENKWIWGQISFSPKGTKKSYAYHVNGVSPNMKEPALALIPILDTYHLRRSIRKHGSLVFDIDLSKLESK